MQADTGKAFYASFGCGGIHNQLNSISPGWIDTAFTVYEGPDATQQPAGRVGNPMDIANILPYQCITKGN